MATGKKTTKATSEKAPAKKAAAPKKAAPAKPAAEKKAPAKPAKKTKAEAAPAPAPVETPAPEPKKKPATKAKTTATKASTTKTSTTKTSTTKASTTKKPATTKAAATKATPAKAEAPKAEPAKPAPKAKKPAAPKTKKEPEAPKVEEKPEPKAAGKSEKPKKPTKGKTTTKDTKKDNKKNTGKETLTAEEKARLAKYKATRALLKADPEWPAFLAAQKELLLQMRDQLLPNMQNVTRDHLRSGASNVSSASGQHIGDAGSEAEVRDLTIRLLDKDREQLFEIDAALERIRLGHYGICEISLDPIPKKRLQVRPACRLTVKCQEEYEKKYGSYANYKAQNSDNVGFSGLQNAMESVISLDETEE